jgi:hypothetical protein
MSNLCLIEAFRSTKYSDKELLPLSRIVNIATATLSPMVAILLSLPESRNRVVDLIDSSVRASAISVRRLPELAAESMLDSSMYDIRGTMRGPGGEDHVGCLAIMRLAYESDDIACVIGHLPAVMTDLCELYRSLKTLEVARGKFIMHGSGVTPKSRRILLGAICHIELKSDCEAGMAKTLQELFEASCAFIASYNGSQDFDEEVLLRIAENIFDLASFPIPILASMLSSNEPLCATCLDVIVAALNHGYETLSVVEPPNMKNVQVR